MANPDAQYVIDIAAGMTDGEHTAKQLDALTASLVGGGREAEHFDEAVALLDAQLRDAADSVSRTNAELAASQKQYSDLQKNADTSAKALERMQARQTALASRSQKAAQALAVGFNI